MAQGTAPLTDIWRNTMLLRIRAGGNMARATFIRADATTCATRIRNDGVVEAVAANVLRTEWVDLDGDGIRETPGLLLEASRVNTLLQSQALATTWVANLLTATNNVAIAPDGTTTATGLVPTAVSSAAHRVSQAITITANENVAFSMKLKANGYTSVRVQIVDTATNTIGFIGRFNASTGLFGTNTTTGGGTIISTDVKALSSGYYHFSIAGNIGSGVTAVTVFIDVFDTIANANSNTAYTGDAVSGVLAWGAQLERGAAFASSYIKTTTGTVTRAADSFTLPFNFGPLDCTVLYRLARPIWADATGDIGFFPEILNLGVATDPNRRLETYFGKTTRVFDSRTGDSASDASAALPAGASFQFISQHKSAATLPAVAVDVGSGLTAFDTGAAAYTAYFTQSLRIGGPSAASLSGVLLDLLICRGLRTRQEMLVLAGRD